MRTLSVYDITEAVDIPFSKSQYSLFKFGSKSIAHTFGKQLFHKFKDYLFTTYGAVYLHKVPQIVVCSAPYNHIPTATGAMKDYFVKYLNEHLAAMGVPVVQETKVHRDTTYREDYGSMSKDRRMELIRRDTFHIDMDFIYKKLVLFIDDIYVTGTHQHMMEKMMSIAHETNRCEYMFLYFAKLTNPHTCPTIENELNYAKVDSLSDVWDIIEQDDFLFNTRVVKYILNAGTEEAEKFLSSQKRGFLDTLYHLAIGNSYHLIPEYEKNLSIVKDLLT